MADLEIAPETEHYFNQALDKFNDVDQVRLREAANQALSLHSEQGRRPSGETYGNHILRVAARIVNEFGLVDQDLFIAALYHDAVEDQLEKLCQDGSASREDAYRYLARRYSTRVSKAVRSVSNPIEIEALQDKELRNKRYIAHVVKGCDQSQDGFIIKLADFFDNAMRLQYNLTHDAKVRGAKKYQPLFDYFIMRLQNGELEIETDRRIELANKIFAQRQYVESL